MKSAFSVTVTSAAGFVAGQFALLDEENYDTGSWVNLPNRNGSPTSDKIWATDRVTWQRHLPTADEDDPFPPQPGGDQGALTWFCRRGRPIAEVKEIASVSGNTVTFTTPIHITYRTSHTAQLTRWIAPNLHIRNAGLEDLKVIGGSDGAIRFEAAAYSWIKGVEDTVWLGEGVAVNRSFRCELRDSYIHDAARSVPGGGAYAVSIADGSAEILVENNIIMKANKMMVGRSSGAGSVIGYNYADDGFIDYALDWVEVGINGSHMVGPASHVVRGERVLQLRLRQHPRQRHLPHGVPEPPERRPAHPHGHEQRASRRSGLRIVVAFLRRQRPWVPGHAGNGNREMGL